MSSERSSYGYERRPSANAHHYDGNASGTRGKENGLMDNVAKNKATLGNSTTFKEHQPGKEFEGERINNPDATTTITASHLMNSVELDQCIEKTTSNVVEGGLVHPRPPKKHKCHACGGSRKVLENNDGAILCSACGLFYDGLKSGESTLPSIKDCSDGLGDCSITEETRTSCRHCRLQRCYNAGCKPISSGSRRTRRPRTRAQPKTIYQDTESDQERSPLIIVDCEDGDTTEELIDIMGID